MAEFKVDRVGGPSGPQRTKKTKAVSDGNESFADALRDAADTQSASASGSVQGVTAVGGIFAVQEVETATDGRSRGLLIGYGDDLLDRLEELRIDLLLGAVPKDKLVDLAHEMRQKRHQVEDPQLNEIIDEIELRAEVEIAKLTRDV